MSLTPRVMTVKRGGGGLILMFTPSSVHHTLIRHCLQQTRSDCARERSDEAIQYFAKQRKSGLLRFARNDDQKILLTTKTSKQTQLLPAAIRLGEMIGRQFGAALVEAEFIAG